MDFKQYSENFQKEASNLGYTQQNIIKCLEYARILIANNVPVIYNTTHLSVLVGYKKSYINRAIIYDHKFYRNFQVLKRNKTYRNISEPLPSLKEIQIWILENILYSIEISPFAKAYRKDVGLIENLKFHKKQPKLLTTDIESFFSSIKVSSVEQIFNDLGYSNTVSYVLARLCTKDQSLPQGAPTSPFLSNVFFKKIDEKISEYCLEKKIRYTRYADDLSFSGEFEESHLIEFIKKVLLPTGLKLNDNKTRLMTSNMRQSVTGIVVNEKIQVVFHKRNCIRQEIYYIKKFGLSEQIKYKKITQKNYLEHLIGKVNFVLQMNKEDKEFQEYKLYLNTLKRGSTNNQVISL